MAGWSSLPPDLVRRVGDCLIATNDIDGYVDMRAVCYNWRNATADPSRRGAGADLARFRPRQWVMLGRSKDNDGAFLFLNTSTGRFLRRRISLVHNYTYYDLVGTSDGLLVLGNWSPPHTTLVLNPFTGSVVRFAAPIPRAGAKVVAVTASDSMLIFGYSHDISVDNEDDISVDNEDGMGSVWFASPTSERFSLNYFCPTLVDPGSMVAYAGHVYMANSDGSVLRSVSRAAGSVVEQLISARYDVSHTRFHTGFPRTHLVESGGELLLARRGAPGAMIIFRVDDERRVLEPVTNMGSRALFLSARCLSVDAEMFPSIGANCVYFMDGMGLSGQMYVYHLNDGTEEFISCVQPLRDPVSLRLGGTHNVSRL